MTAVDGYEGAFSDAKLTRCEDGVLEVVLHTDGVHSDLRRLHR